MGLTVLCHCVSCFFGFGRHHNRRRLQRPSLEADSAVVEAAAGGARCGCAAVGRRCDWCRRTAASTATAAAAAAESTRRFHTHRLTGHHMGLVTSMPASVAASDRRPRGPCGDRGVGSALGRGVPGRGRPHSALDSDGSKNRLPQACRRHLSSATSAGGASTHPLTAGRRRCIRQRLSASRGWDQRTAERDHRGVCADSAHGGAPAACSSGSGGSGNSFIQNFAEHLIEGGGINLDPALMDQMIEGVEDANGADGSSMFDSGALSISSAKISAAKLKASKSRQGRPKKCNCTRSKCLKLYCDCFSWGTCDGQLPGLRQHGGQQGGDRQGAQERPQAQQERIRGQVR